MKNVSIITGAQNEQIASWIERKLQASFLAGDEPVAFTMPGGSTPFPILEILARRELDWSRVIVWPGDDRIVPEDHPASNTGKIRATLEPLGAKVVALSLESQLPRFAFAWLGMGADGHIASLFPNTDPQIDDPLAIRQLTPEPLPPEAPFDRITLTIPSLLNSDAVLFTLGGSAEKRAVFDAAVAGEHALPIARILGAAEQEVTCFA